VVEPKQIKPEGQAASGAFRKRWLAMRFELPPALHTRGLSGATWRVLLSTMSITVIVENDTIKLPVHVPDGTRLEITLPAEATTLSARGPAEDALAGLAPFVGKISTLPSDFAERHDEYIHGRKRGV
jgi:hypothetical protein